MSMPKDIRHHLAKAKGYLQKNDAPQALESIAEALRDMRFHHLRSATVVEREINVILQSLSTTPHMLPLLDPLNSGTAHVLRYQYGKEGALVTVLREFAKILREQSQKYQETQRTEHRLQDLIEKGNSLLENGQLGTGAAFLQRAVSEYPKDAQHISDIGHILCHYKQYAAAGKVYMASLAHHPKHKDFYSSAIEAYVQAGNYTAAELIFLKAFQQFGRHPRSLAKLAELYLLWDKADEAKEIAQEALALNAEEEAAQKVLLSIASST